MRSYWNMEGYKVLKAYDGLEALDLLVGNQIHLILLDVMMPKLNGLSTMMKIRESKNIPIIILSAKTEESDMVLGLSMGADDYIAKTLQYGRADREGKIAAAALSDTGSGCGQCSVQLHYCRRADSGFRLQGNYCGRKKCQATATEYKIMELLMRNPGRVFSLRKSTAESGMKMHMRWKIRLWCISAGYVKK